MGAWDNLRKTIDFAKRNGVGAAFRAAQERLLQNQVPYTYEAPAEDCLREQRAFYSRRVMEAKGKRLLKFSLLTPAYLTDKEQLTQLIESVKLQTYGEWELIVADASPEHKRLEYTVAQAARDGRVKYTHLPVNAGIAFNTNAALKSADGDYVVLVDHDDLLTPDALFELEKAITGGNGTAVDAKPDCLLVYSDEDKFSEEEGRRRYFEPHFKTEFDFDKFLSNNYICHLTAVRTDIARKLQLRSVYDGAQDYDLFLRVVAEALFDESGRYLPPQEVRRVIRHVPKVLYHWRAHAQSTAAAPANKRYAHDAGKRALADFCTEVLLKVPGVKRGTTVQVTELAHRGFYRAEFQPDLFAARPDVAVIGGKITNRKGVLTGGKTDAEGQVYYEGTPRGHSGGLQHPAVLRQEAEIIDLRAVKIRPELIPLYEEITGLPWHAPGEQKTEEEAKAEGPAENAEAAKEEEGVLFELSSLAAEADLKERARTFCAMVRDRGYRILWDPQFSTVREEEE
ncbi:MAG: glycosyltransferase [Lachnospiraceae bacterium]|nr:glycosyltransferase [Lachnospiraceae bacterium]